MIYKMVLRSALYIGMVCTLYSHGSYSPYVKKMKEFAYTQITRPPVIGINTGAALWLLKDAVRRKSPMKYIEYCISAGFFIAAGYGFHHALSHKDNVGAKNESSNNLMRFNDVSQFTTTNPSYTCVLKHDTQENTWWISYHSPSEPQHSRVISAGYFKLLSSINQTYVKYDNNTFYCYYHGDNGGIGNHQLKPWRDSTQWYVTQNLPQPGEPTTTTCQYGKNNNPCTCAT